MGTAGHRTTVWLVFAIILSVGLATFPRWTVDDAYILIRYAENLVASGALVWNPGAAPVEGYTGVLTPLFLAGAVRLGAPPISFGQVLGAVSFAVIAASFARILERNHVARPVILVAAIILVTCPILYTHTFSGLETMPYTALILGSFLVFQATSPGATPGGAPRLASHVPLAVLLLLLSLARPEGAVFALGASLVTLVRCAQTHPPDSRFAPRPWWIYVGLLGIPLVTYHLVRWNYYGSLFPNPFLVKTLRVFEPAPGLTATLDLLTFGKRFLAAPILATAMLLWMRPGGTLGPGANGRAGRRWYALVAYGAPSVIILAVYLNSRLLMNFSHRFFVPFYPLALIGLASLCPTSSGPAGLDPAARRTAESTGARVRHAWQTALPLALLGLQLAYNAVMFFGAEADYVRSYRTLIADEHVPAGQFLHRAVPEDEWVVVHVDAGAIPYYSKRPTIDFGGLTDRFLARTRSLPERVDYAFAHDPAAFVFTSYRWDRVDHGEEADRIVKDPRFRRYRLVRKYRTEAPGLESYYEFVFLREDLVGRVGVPVGISSPGNGLAHLYLGSPSGLYLLRMTTPGQESARKLWITR